LPDAWQQTAIRALVEGRDVVVQAPTGAGKTFVFEQYFQQSRKPGQVIYTVPTRALANDKFAEWSHRGWKIGLTTGDRTHQPDAPLVVATLESQQNPRNAHLYVIDEYQWLADAQRGNHYEGVMLTLPSTTQLLLLSGSVANPDQIADWLQQLGRKTTTVIQKERPVPLDEVDLSGLAHSVDSKITGFWTRALYAALREDLGPVLVFTPHRKEAEKLARQVASLPCLQPLSLTPVQEKIAGPDLAKLLRQRIAYHHSGLSYEQRAGLVEPLAKAGQLRVVVATLGLSSGINFSLRSVLVTSTSYTVGGIPREVLPSDLLQMFGRAGRRGLDEQGYVLVAAQTARLSQARPRQLKRSPALPWHAVLRTLADGADPYETARRFAPLFFNAQNIALGVEHTSQIPEELPCRLRTDTGRARLIRREKDPFPGCQTCSHAAACLALDPAPTVFWLWNRLGLLDKHLHITPRGQIASGFMGPEGLGVAAAIENPKMPLEELVHELGDLVAGDRFCGQESRWAGPVALACHKAYRRLAAPGFLEDGVPINYGTGGAEIIQARRQGLHIKPELLGENATQGDVDRLWIEWKSLLRQVTGAPAWDIPRWQEFQSLCRTTLDSVTEAISYELPPLSESQRRLVSHRLR
jgi:superfamily II DNA/RNA helicase